MHKNFKILMAVLMPLLTLAVWLIWKFAMPQLKEQLLSKASNYVETKILTKKRRSVDSPGRNNNARR